MTDPLTLTVVSAGSAVVATLITIVLTPRLQHVYWTHQRRSEARVAAIRSINQLMAEFITNHIDATSKGQIHVPTIQFFQAFQVGAADVKALFPEDVFEVFKELEVMVGPHLGPKTKGNTVQDFIEARGRALQAMYKKAGLV
jgi:hypothetical protein